MPRIALAVCLFALTVSAAAADPSILGGGGTWVQRSAPGVTAPLVFTVEEAGPARKITYGIRNPDGKMAPGFSMTVTTLLDGKDAEVLTNGQSMAQTMAIKKIDALHFVTIHKHQGKQFGTTKAELSADGKVMKVEDDYSMSVTGQKVGKTTQFFDRK